MFSSVIKSCSLSFFPECPRWLLPEDTGISQSLPKHGRTLLHPLSCSRASQQTFLIGLEVCPLGCGGAGIALPLPFSQVLVPPVPSTCVLFRYSHSLSTSSSSDSVTASNLEPLTFSEEAPSPCTQNHPFLWALPALGGFPKSCQSSVYSASTEDWDS